MAVSDLRPGEHLGDRRPGHLHRGEPPPEEAGTPIDRFLAVQADLRVVERFARTDVSDRTGRWSELIPLSAPAPGEQYRFDVDLDSCTGCKACVTACHNLNGLDEGESFRSIGLLITTPPAGPEPEADPGPAEQTVTTACHHCADPGCLNGCPAEAYQKDPVTGIVKHLDDACIGCRYCTLTCPYDVPVYNDRLGIVRKCDLCADRLADGEAPACVQGCPTHAISVTTVPVADLDATALVPGAAASALTKPVTRYRGRSLQRWSSAEVASIDGSNPAPQHAHLPLVFMLVLSQWAVGLIVGSLADVGSLAVADGGNGGNDGNDGNDGSDVVAIGAALLGLSALASVAHLGRPLKAWRAVLGWSHSWLSREVLALGATIGLAGSTVAAIVVAGPSPGPAVASSLHIATAVVGLGAVACSVMIYVVTGRRFWRTTPTAIRFFGTVGLSVITLFAVTTVVGPARADNSATAVVIAVALVGVLGIKLVVERSVLSAAELDLRRTAILLRGPLASPARVRVRLAVIGAALIGTALIATALTGGSSVAGDPSIGRLVVGLGVALIAAGELFERWLFFRACAPVTMPGAHR